LVGLDGNQRFAYSLRTMQTEKHPIAAGRNRLGLTLDEFGRDLGVSGMTVWRWEQGRSLPHRKRWNDLEAKIGCPIGEILAAGKPASGGAG
jgi:DNA-binding XRE family transcriptional regulator